VAFVTQSPDSQPSAFSLELLSMPRQASRCHSHAFHPGLAVARLESYLRLSVISLPVAIQRVFFSRESEPHSAPTTENLDPAPHQRRAASIAAVCSKRLALGGPL